MEHLCSPIGHNLANWIIGNDYSRLWLTSIASRIFNKSHRTMGKSTLLHFSTKHTFQSTVAGSNFVYVIANTFDHCLGAWLLISVKKGNSDQIVTPLIKKGSDWRLRRQYLSWFWDPLLITFTNLVCDTVKTLPNGTFTFLELDSLSLHEVSKNALSNPAWITLRNKVLGRTFIFRGSISKWPNCIILLILIFPFFCWQFYTHCYKVDFTNADHNFRLIAAASSFHFGSFRQTNSQNNPVTHILDPVENVLPFLWLIIFSTCEIFRLFTRTFHFSIAFLIDNY